tara:strand:+ start:256 stop:471 length:216 start_codon:yes stop_codon:yes gene_type:complete
MQISDKHKHFNQAIDKEIEYVKMLIKNISDGRYHIDFFTGKRSFNVNEYCKELENQKEQLKNWKNKVNNEE